MVIVVKRFAGSVPDLKSGCLEDVTFRLMDRLLVRFEAFDAERKSAADAVTQGRVVGGVV